MATATENYVIEKHELSLVLAYLDLVQDGRTALHKSDLNLLNACKGILENVEARSLRPTGETIKHPGIVCSECFEFAGVENNCFCEGGLNDS